MSRQIFSPSWHNVANLRPRLLPHARFHRHVYRGQLWHVIHDATSGKYHRMSPGAYLLTRRMDGRQTVQALWDHACRTAGEDIPTQNEVVELLSQLHASDLLHCDVTPDAAQLLERHKKQRFAKWKQRLGNPLGMRLPLVQPDAFLTRYTRLIRHIFSVPGALVWLLIVLPALFLAGAHFQELTSNLSDRILSQQNLWLLGLLFIPVKVLHELGHGMATKRWGGTVPEMGVMFLVFAPVPYCDSSSASAFRNKYQRAIVGAAGMMVELVLASVAVYIWVLVEPGPLRAVAFNVIVIAGVSTVLVNGNPLLRFDGYYILADLIEMPNLAQRGQKYCTYLLDRYAFGAREQEPPAETSGEKLWLVPYTVASWLYRVMITTSIILFIAGKFFIFGVLLALWGAGQFLLLPIYKSIRHVTRSPSLHRHRSRATRLSLAATAAVLIAILLVPVPSRTQAQGVVWLPDSALLRTRTDGTFERWLAQPGQHVVPGTPLLLMSDPTLDAELETARARVAEFQARYDAQQFDEPAAAEITLTKLEQQRHELTRAEERHSLLVVTSASEGVLVAPEYADLPGQRLRKGTLLGYLMDRQKLLARVAVVQEDIDLVRSRLRGAELRLAENLGETHAVAVLREVPGAVDELPSKALSPEGGGQIVTDPKDPNGLKVLNRVFLFDLGLPADASPDTFGSHVYVRFQHLNEPLAAQWRRRLRQLFLSHFDV